MALFRNTVIELVQQMGRLLFKYDEFFEGTVDSGTTTTVVDDERQEIDDFFQNTQPVSNIRIVTTTDGAAPQGESSRITDSAHSTGTITISSDKPFTVAPDAGDTYIILNEYKWPEILSSLNLAISHATSEGVFIEKVDETVEVAASVYDYTIPEGFTHIYRVTQADGNGDFLTPIASQQYIIIRGTASPLLHFSTFSEYSKHEDYNYSNLWAGSDLTAGRILRIEGLQKQAKLINDTDICYLNPEYMIYQAMYYMHVSRMRKADQDEHGVQAGVCREIAARALRSSKQPFPPNIKRVET